MSFSSKFIGVYVPIIISLRNVFDKFITKIKWCGFFCPTVYTVLYRTSLLNYKLPVVYYT